MITKLSILLPELTIEQLNDVRDWLCTKSKLTLGERIQAYLEKNKNATLSEISDRLRVPIKETIKELINLIDYEIVEVYSVGTFKSKYRIKR